MQEEEIAAFSEDMKLLQLKFFGKTYCEKDVKTATSECLNSTVKELTVVFIKLLLLNNCVNAFSEEKAFWKTLDNDTKKEIKFAKQCTNLMTDRIDKILLKLTGMMNKQKLPLQ